MEKKPQLIVALDVEKVQDAERLVKILYPIVKLFKIGSQLYTAAGPDVVRMVGRTGGRVFLDLKFHDIPNTVRNAIISGTSVSCVVASMHPGLATEISNVVQYPVFMMTIHAIGGEEMMRFAAEAARQRAEELNIEKPKIVGITVLTSDAASGDTQKEVVKRALAARHSGLDGVVCSVYEAAAVRKACGEKFIIVTPGIRSNKATADDQKRTATAKEASDAGSDFLVVGRPIVEALDPLEAIRDFTPLENELL
jgi:orotidine-5'-phosphate decarboxylase